MEMNKHGDNICSYNVKAWQRHPFDKRRNMAPAADLRDKNGVL